MVFGDPSDSHPDFFGREENLHLFHALLGQQVNPQPAVRCAIFAFLVFDHVDPARRQIVDPVQTTFCKICHITPP